jgi:hypothetical protein
MDRWPDHPRCDSVADLCAAQAAAGDTRRNGYHDDDNTTHRHSSSGRPGREHDNTTENAVRRSIESSIAQKASYYAAKRE